jgi:hypothetical protein
MLRGNSRGYWMSSKQELERDIATLERDIVGMSDLVASIGGSANVTGPKPSDARDAMIAKREQLQSELRALDD